MPTIIPDVDPVVRKIERITGNLGVVAMVGVVLVAAPIVLLWILLKLQITRDILSNQLALSIIVGALVLFILLHLAGLGTLFERKIASWIQDRIGPNRVGYWGILQPLADGIKFITKEDIIPGNVEKPAFVLAPFLGLFVAFVTFAVIPWAGYVKWPWMPEGAKPLHTAVADLDIGILYMLALGSLSVYGVVLGGWASNNKYAFYGGTRAAAQMISYEVPLGLGLLVVFLVSGTLSGSAIIDDQVNSGIWNVFMHPIAAVLVLVAGFAEANRTPFDLAESEQELVGGYHTEYSAMKLAVFLLGEYIHMMVGSALFILLFFGGWSLLPSKWGQLGITVDNTHWLAALVKFGVFWGKICAMLFLYMVIRWTIPRYRFDQLMQMAWKGLIPAGIVMVFVTAVLTAFNLHTHKHWYVSLAANVVVFIVILMIQGASRAKITGRQTNLPELKVVPA